MNIESKKLNYLILLLIIVEAIIFAYPVKTFASQDKMPLKFLTIESETNTFNSILKNPAQNVSFPLSQEDLELINKMKEKLYELEGVGLAAPQVGYHKRIALIYIPESAVLLRDNAVIKDMHVLINPEYSPVDKNDKKQDFEGCYSVETVMAKVPRFNKITVKYQNEKGEVIEKMAEGFYARVLQHEIDHLNGILFTDRLTYDCLVGDIKSMQKIRRSELPEDKRKLYDDLLDKKRIKKSNEN